MRHPNLYIIAGPNGAGKTTASYTLLPEMLGCVNFVNADEIARGLSPFSPNTVDVQAARIMLQRINELLAQKVHLLFFCLESPEQAIQRVAQRVSNGGHDIPEDVIRRRFTRGLDNLIHLYLPICDGAMVFNNVKTPAQLIARKKNLTDEIEVVKPKMWNQLMQIL